MQQKIRISDWSIVPGPTSIRPPFNSLGQCEFAEYPRIKPRPRFLAPRTRVWSIRITPTGGPGAHASFPGNHSSILRWLSSNSTMAAPFGAASGSPVRPIQLRFSHCTPTLTPGLHARGSATQTASSTTPIASFDALVEPNNALQLTMRLTEIWVEFCKAARVTSRKVSAAGSERRSVSRHERLVIVMAESRLAGLEGWLRSPKGSMLIALLLTATLVSQIDSAVRLFCRVGHHNYVHSRFRDPQVASIPTWRASQTFRDCNYSVSRRLCGLCDIRIFRRRRDCPRASILGFPGRSAPSDGNNPSGAIRVRDARHCTTCRLTRRWSCPACALSSVIGFWRRALRVVAIRSAAGSSMSMR